MIEVVVFVFLVLLLAAGIFTCKKKMDQEAMFAQDNDYVVLDVPRTIRFDPIVKVYDAPMTQDDIAARRSITPSLPIPIPAGPSFTQGQRIPLRSGNEGNS